MSATLLAAAAGAVAVGALLAVRELGWRRLIGQELASEVELGIISKRDYDVLVSWKRFRRGWLAGSRERRAFRRIAVRLARAKAAQRRAPGNQGRLLQVQVLTLRTRLRHLERPRWETASDNEPSVRSD